ncbi:MAG: hypothetical protein UR15_C0037G0002 [Parcubacteria group bacterium GW2011_GWA2_31_28]|nr:MAG: hypothetical protein UR15_C0037G0002 [Parcubacteria group bacterium GW2011_GWA2_31_28]
MPELHYDFYLKARKGNIFERIYHPLNVKLLTKHITNKGKILDLGCGSGLFTIPLAKKGCNVVACDITEESLKQLKRYAKKEDVEDKITIVHGDATKLKFRNNEFDKITMFFILEHLNKNERIKALKEVRRILKPGGLLYIAVPWFYNPVWHLLFLRKIFSGRKDLDEEPVHKPFKPSQLNALVSGYGFKKEYLKVYNLIDVLGIFRKI